MRGKLSVLNYKLNAWPGFLQNNYGQKLDSLFLNVANDIQHVKIFLEQEIYEALLAIDSK